MKLKLHLQCCDKGAQSVSAQVMHIRYHSIANLHSTEVLSILILTKYNENNIIGLSKSILKNRFFSKQLKIKQNTTKVEDVHVHVLFKVRKVVSRSAWC